MVFYHSAVYYELRGFIDRYEFPTPFNTLVPFDIILGKDGKVSPKKFVEFDKVVSLFHKKIGGKLMLDCGAFSAYHRGFAIEVSEYIKFIKEYGNNFDEIVALDVIGDGVGTWQNYVAMQEAGIARAIPVFHIREPISFFERLAESTNYIGIGQPSGLRGKDIIGTYHNFLYEQNSDIRFKNNRMHGFGIGTPDFFQVYPWFSCDASNASVVARYGSVPLIRNKNGHFEYKSIPVSSRQKKDREHYSNLPEMYRHELDLLMNKFGNTIEDFDEDSVKTEGDALHNRILFGIRVFDMAIDWLNRGLMKEFRPSPSLF